MVIDYIYCTWLNLTTNNEDIEFVSGLPVNYHFDRQLGITFPAQSCFSRYWLVLLRYKKTYMWKQLSVVLIIQ